MEQSLVEGVIDEMKKLRARSLECSRRVGRRHRWAAAMHWSGQVSTFGLKRNLNKKVEVQRVEAGGWIKIGISVVVK